MIQPAATTIPIPPTDHSAKRVSAEECRDAWERKLKQVCSDFEAIFIYRMLETMRRTVPEGGFISGSGGLGNNPYQALMDQKLSETLASQGGGIGIARVLYEQLRGDFVREKD